MFIKVFSSIFNASNHIQCVSLSLSNQKCKIQPTHISLHPNKYVRNFTTNHLGLNEIDVLEVIILLLNYLIECMFQIKQKI